MEEREMFGQSIYVYIYMPRNTYTPFCSPYATRISTLRIDRILSTKTLLRLSRPLVKSRDVA